MLSQAEISHLKEIEKDLLFSIRNRYSMFLKVIEQTQEGILHIIIKSPATENDIEIFYDKDDIVLVMGKWTHTHPDKIVKLLTYIDKIINEQIVIWKITCPNGEWCAGHYDIALMLIDPILVNAPTGVAIGDRIEKSTFRKIIEDRIIE